MALIQLCADVRHPDEQQTFAHEGSIADFMAKQFPEGSKGRKAKAFTEDGTEIEDWGRPLADDEAVIVAVSPGQLALVVNIVIAVASAIITNLISPKPPTFVGAPEPSQVYSVGVQTNQARLGAVIPVQYGRVKRAPDLASISYRKFLNNKEMRYFIFCLGAGLYDGSSLDLYVGGTNAKALPSSILSWRMFGPGQHNRQLGKIEAEFGVHEDVYTSGEVAQQPLESDPAADYDVTTFYVSNDSQGRGVLSLQASPDSLGISAGGTVTVSGSQPTGGNGPATYATTTGDVDGIYNVVSVSGNAVTVMGEFSVTGEFSGTVEGSGGAQDNGSYAGPFVTCPPGKTVDRIEFDIELPSGLFTSNDDGSLANNTVTLGFRMTPIDDDGNVTGSPITFDPVLTRSTNDPIRLTYGYNVPAGRYLAEARRVGGDQETSSASRTLWTGLKGYIKHAAGTPAYGEVTLLVVKLSSAEELSSGAQQRIQVTATRRIERYDTGQTTGTADPAHVMADIYCNADYSVGRPFSEIEDETFDALRDLDVPGANGVFDTETTIYDALRSVGQFVHAEPVWRGNKLAVDHDKAKPTVSTLFSPDNIVAGSLKMTSQVGAEGDEDGFTIEFRDPDTGVVDAVTWPTSAIRPTRRKLFCFTYRAAALAYAQRLWKQKLLRHTRITFATEQEGRLVERGERIHVAAPWLDAGEGRVVTGYGPTWIGIDQPFEETGQVPVMIRDSRGRAYGPHTMTASGNLYLYTTPSGSALPFPASAFDDASEGGVLAILRPAAGEWIDMIVTDVRQRSGLTFEISGYAYDERVYA